MVGFIDQTADAAATEVADYLLAECRERGENLTNLKLQKLLYYADAWAMVMRGAPLFPEQFRAWVHGPVLLSQYHRFKDFRWRPITDDVAKPALSPDLSAHLNEVVDVFGSETAVGLELMTHRERPWIEARGGLPADAPSSACISKKTTLEFYRAVHESED